MKESTGVMRSLKQTLSFFYTTQLFFMEVSVVAWESVHNKILRNCFRNYSIEESWFGKSFRGSRLGYAETHCSFSIDSASV